MDIDSRIVVKELERLLNDSKEKILNTRPDLSNQTANVLAYGQKDGVKLCLDSINDLIKYIEKNGEPEEEEQN